jgi:hypothetical protein
MLTMQMVLLLTMDYKYPSSPGHSNIFFKLAFEVLKEKKTGNVKKVLRTHSLIKRIQFHTASDKFQSKPKYCSVESVVCICGRG